MSLLEQEIADDYDLDNDITDVNHLDDQLCQLFDSVGAIETFGIDPVSATILKTTGLMDSASHDALAIEFYYKPNDEKSQLAVESLLDNIKEKAVAWAAKIANVVKNITSSFLNATSAIWAKITSLTKVLATKTWNATKAATTYVKAHPFKTIIAVLGAIAIVIGVMALVATGMPGAYANESALQSFVYKMQDMIKGIGGKWPFGKVTCTIVKDGSGFATIVENDPIGATANVAGKMGWTQSSVKAISSKLGSLYSSMKGGAGAVGSKLMGSLKFLDNIGSNINETTKNFFESKLKSKSAGYVAGFVAESSYKKLVWDCAITLYRLFKTIVIRGYTLIRATLQALVTLTV